jgi:hypothetical protein
VHGTGVFAARTFSKGDKILVMTGKYIPRGVTTTAMDNRYSYRIYNNPLTDGLRMLRDQECNIGKFVNCASGTDRRPNCHAGAEENYRFLIFLVALRQIDVGEELVANYRM